MTEFDLAQIPADEGVRFLFSGFLADPWPALAAIVQYVMVPAAVAVAGLCALVALVTRHSDAALPGPDQAPPAEEPSLAVDVLVGRVPVDQTVVIERSAR